MSTRAATVIVWSLVLVTVVLTVGFWGGVVYSVYAGVTAGSFGAMIPGAVVAGACWIGVLVAKFCGEVVKGIVSATRSRSVSIVNAAVR